MIRNEEKIAAQKAHREAEAKRVRAVLSLLGNRWTSRAAIGFLVRATGTVQIPGLVHRIWRGRRPLSPTMFYRLQQNYA